RTWAPDFSIVAVKPFWNIGKIEKRLHAGLAQFWHSGEWHDFTRYHEKDEKWFYEAFEEFSDTDQNRNSFDFPRWMQGTGLFEIEVARTQEHLSVRQWQECYARPYGRA